MENMHRAHIYGPEAILRLVLAQSDNTDMPLNARGMRRIARQLRHRARILPTAHGQLPTSHALLRPDANPICAVAAVELYAAVKGHRPRRSLGDALELCQFLHELATGKELPPEKTADVWEHHLRKVVENRHYGTDAAAPPLYEAREVVRGVLISAGLVSRASPIPPGRAAGKRSRGLVSKIDRAFFKLQATKDAIE